jgi:hypothetical protein
MTVKLLADWGPQPAGTLFSGTAATETAMVTAKVATTDLTGGEAWRPVLGSRGAGTAAPDRSKIAATIAAAVADNPVILAPWTVPPVWTPSTVYASATYVRGIGAGNTENLFHCSTSGTSAAATGPVGTGLAEQADNTARWIYAGKARSVGTYPLMSTVIPAAVTDQMNGYLCLVPTSARATLGLTRQHLITFQNPIGRWTGGPLIAGFAGTQLDMVGAREGGAPGARTSAGARWCLHFQTNARNWIYIAANDNNTPNRQLRIEVNGRGLTEYSFRMNATAGSALLLDLSTFGPGAKDIRIYGTFSLPEQLFNIYTEADAFIWKPEPRNGLKICFEGDSITQGGSSETTPASELIENVTARLLGIDSWYNNAVGASGCLQTNSGTRTNYPQRLVDVVAENPDIFVIGGFHNDASFSSAERQAAFLAYFQLCRAAMPACTIFVTGTQTLLNESTTATGSADLLTIERDSKIAFDQWGDANAAFIPLLTDLLPFPPQTTAGWFFCSPQGGNANGHPIFRYSRSIAEKIAHGIRQFYR